MSECTVRIKNKKTGDHLMVKPEYAARTKMLKNSGWVVEDLPENKQEIKPDELLEFPLDEEHLIQDGEDEFSDQPLNLGNQIDTFDEALTEKETGLTIDQQQQKEDAQQVAEESKEENQTVDILNQEVKATEPTPRKRGRQPGSTNKPK